MNAPGRKEYHDSLSPRLSLLKERIRAGLYEAGLDAYNDGNRVLARERMEQLLKLDPHNQDAWNFILRLSREFKESVVRK